MAFNKTIWLILFTGLISCNFVNNNNNNKMSAINTSGYMQNIDTDTATFGTGCFWCTEAIFQQLKGVLKVSSGYSGGHTPNPDYRSVSTGTTGHAEVIQIVFNPSEISFDELLSVFWQTHDPTTLNRQGNDVGTQYRSAIFFHNELQQQKAREYKEKLEAAKAFDNPIVTEISPFTKFYVAEDYHQNYYNNNPNQPYCYYVVKPKLEKFKKVFADKLRNK